MVNRHGHCLLPWLVVVAFVFSRGLYLVVVFVIVMVSAQPAMTFCGIVGWSLSRFMVHMGWCGDVGVG